jgi:hypothetical protein
VRMILTTEREAVVIPESAVQPGQKGPFVYVFEPGEGDGAGRARVQPIRIDRQLGERVVIADGLKGGERVITEVPPGLSPGSPVRLPGKGAGKKGGEGKGGEGKGGEAKAAAPGDAPPPSDAPAGKGAAGKGAAGKAADGNAAPRKGEQPK